MKYTAEEVRAHAKMLRDCRVNTDATRDRQQDKLADICDAYADLLERIKVDEGAADYPECSGDPSSCPENEGRGCCKPNTPAQAAQADKPPRLGGCCCGEPCTLGVVHRTDGPCFHYVEPTAEPVEQGEAVIDAKYDNVLVPFARLMAKELHANAGKGDRPGWLSMTPAVGMLEIYYHATKLQKSVKDSNGDGIREYAADVANMAMMLLDVCGGLAVTDPVQPGEPAAKREVVAFRYRFRDGHGRWLGWHYSNRPPRTFVEGDNLQGEPLFNAQPAELPKFLKDPANVHAMMLRGAIAIPSIRSMVDLRGEVPNGEDVQLARIAELQEQVAALEAQPAERVSVPITGSCVWAQDGDDSHTWSTGCGNVFLINEGAPSENGMRFCCYCGKSVEQYLSDPEEDDHDIS